MLPLVVIVQPLLEEAQRRLWRDLALFDQSVQAGATASISKLSSDPANAENMSCW